MLGIDDERNQIVSQTLLEHDEAPDSAVSILKRMNPFKIEMEFHNAFNRTGRLGKIGRQQHSQLFPHLIRRRRILFADRIGQFFVSSDPEPVETALRSSLLQQKMVVLDDLFRQRFFRSIEHVVERGKMIECFNDVVCPHRRIFFAENGMGFVNIPGLIVSQLIAFNPVGVVGNRNLCIMIQPALDTGVFFPVGAVPVSCS